MKKQYIEGYTYQFHARSLINPAMVVLSNKLPYGNGRLEAHIIVEQGKFHIAITDGYKYLETVSSMNQGLKSVMNIAHGKMQSITHNMYSRLD